MRARLDSRVINAKAVLGNMVRRKIAEQLDEASFLATTKALERQLIALCDDVDLPGGATSRAVQAVQDLQRHYRLGCLTDSGFLELTRRAREALVDMECDGDCLGDAPPIDLTNGHGEPVTTLRRRWSPRVIDGGLAAETALKGH